MRRSLPITSKLARVVKRHSLFPRPGLNDLFGLAIFILVIFFIGNFCGDPGLGWHLRTGEWIVNNSTLPSSDLFLNPVGQGKWICNQWLADVLIWKVFQAGGWPLLHLMTAGI